MTASGPDRNTKEFEMMSQIITTSTGAKMYFSADVPKEEREKILKHREEYLAPLMMFIRLTGPFPTDTEKQQARKELLAPALKQGFFAYLIHYLETLKEWAEYENLIDAYKKGTITPALLDVLKEQPPAIPEEYRGLEPTAIVFRLVQEGKLDFEPFRREIDIEPNWFMFYRVSFTPLMHMRRGLDEIAGMIGPGREGTLAHLKTQVKILLQGQRPSPEMLKRTGGKGADTYVIEPVAPELLEQYAEAVELQYKSKARGKTPRNFSSPFNTVNSAGLYVNPATLQITDLRPFQEELNSLLAVKSWAYLKDYARAIREAIAEFKGETEPLEAPPSIFENAFIKMLNANPVNNIVNINTSLSGRPGQQYGQQNMFTKEWEYKRDKTEMNFPVKTVDGKVLPPEFSTSTWKTMHFLSLLFTANNSHKRGTDVQPVVETSVREYMLATGRKVTTTNVKNTTRTLKKDLALLNEIKLKHTDKKYSLDLVRPFPEVKLERGKVKVGFSPSFANYLVKQTGLLMNYPAGLLKLKENNSNLYPLGYKLALYRSNDANIRTSKANILSVASCLESCPGIPSIEDVRKHRNSPAVRIIEPFEKALDDLQKQGILASWEYCLPKGEPLKNPVVTDYNYFITLLIRYEVTDYPIKEEQERIDKNAEKKQKRKARQERFVDQALARKKAEAMTDKK